MTHKYVILDGEGKYLDTFFEKRDFAYIKKKIELDDLTIMWRDKPNLDWTFGNIDCIICNGIMSDTGSSNDNYERISIHECNTCGARMDIIITKHPDKNYGKTFNKLVDEFNTACSESSNITKVDTVDSPIGCLCSMRESCSECDGGWKY